MVLINKKKTVLMGWDFPVFVLSHRCFLNMASGCGAVFQVCPVVGKGNKKKKRARK
jgi:hypothetical protein